MLNMNNSGRKKTLLDLAITRLTIVLWIVKIYMTVAHESNSQSAQNKK